MSNKEMRTQHLRAVSIHETCHAFAALQRSSAVMLTININKNYGKLPHHKIWDGRVEATPLDDDPFLDSVYGWAGIVGEAIEVDEKNAVELAWGKYKNANMAVSDTDMNNICSVAPEHRLGAAQAACNLLKDNWSEIKEVQIRFITSIEEQNLTIYAALWMKKSGWRWMEDF